MIHCQERCPEPDPPPPSAMPASKAPETPANYSFLGADTWRTGSCDRKLPGEASDHFGPRLWMAPKNVLLSESTVPHKFNFCLLSQKNSLVREEAGAQGGEGCAGAG